MLPMANTIVRTALGTKSKLIRRQIMLRLDVEGFVDNVVFMIIPGLNKQCIIGINNLTFYNCIMDFTNKKLTFNMYNPKADENEQRVVDIIALDVNKKATN